MPTLTANQDPRLLCWQRVREFAVPPSMIESATARRSIGDWAGACAAARVDADLNLRNVARAHGREFAAQIRADLRKLAPDLLRWHMPRIAPDGLLRPGLTISLARYESYGQGAGGVPHLVVRTPPAWADGGQRLSLAVWDGSRSGAGPSRHPHPRPSRRFRFDLHRHLWDASKSEELRVRSGADRPRSDGDSGPWLELPLGVPGRHECAVDRWAAEAQILLRDQGRAGGAVAVRLAARFLYILELNGGGEADIPRGLRIAAGKALCSALPLLPDAATWVLPDLALLRAGLIEADQLHPLVARALVPGFTAAALTSTPDDSGGPRLIDCRGAQHRIGIVNGVLVPLDHDPDEIRREELLAALTGTPLPCLQAIDTARRHPESLVDIRARLDHGDTAGALATVEALLGPGTPLATGALRDELERAALRRVAHGLFRSGLSGTGPGKPTSLGPERSRDYRAHPRHALG